MRFSLPEIEDIPACPRWLRDAMTGYLSVALTLSKPYAVVVPTLARLLRESGRNQILDLASGGGGPWPSLLGPLRAEAGSEFKVMLSDAQPNRTAAATLERLPGVTYRLVPLSALEVPSTFDGMRTMFTALHHFEPDEVRAMLRSAQEARVPFLAAEATHRSVRGLLVTLLIPILALLLMPRVQPRRAVALLLTYLPPIVPLAIWWDGFVSTMKSYRAAELERIIGEIRQPGYEWRVEEVRGPGAPIPVTVVLGRPVA